mmetsp:Transcript_54645/g.63879  ORF Transcript_54645/g.63879 Transcript_54645/m.63879 type:complete len:121 (-) Transcript_54645:1386-1748(-)
MTRVHSSSIRNKMRLGGFPPPIKCHTTSIKTPITRAMGMRDNVIFCPHRWAIRAPNPEAWRAKTAILDIVAILAKNAVSATRFPDDAAGEGDCCWAASRLATSSARWKESNTVVEEKSAL